MRVIVVAGPAGAGKSTLGRALAADLGAALLDLDDLTNPLLDALWTERVDDLHWNDQAHRSVVRPARYAVLRSAAAAQVASGVDVVLVAPFTAELRGGAEWEALTAAVAPATPFVVWIDVPAAVVADRLRSRAELRDAGAVAAPAATPAVPHFRVDGTASTLQNVDAVLAGIV